MRFFLGILLQVILARREIARAAEYAAEMLRLFQGGPALFALDNFFRALAEQGGDVGVDPAQLFAGSRPGFENDRFHTRTVIPFWQMSIYATDAESQAGHFTYSPGCHCRMAASTPSAARFAV